MHGAGFAGAGDTEGAADDFGQLFRRLHLHGQLRDWFEQFRAVQFRQDAAPFARQWNVDGQQDYRHRRSVRFRERRQRIHRTCARRAFEHARLVGKPSVGVRHEAGRALIAGHHMANSVFTVLKRLIEWDVRIPGDAEDRINAIANQHFHQNIRTAHFALSCLCCGIRIGPPGADGDQRCAGLMRHEPSDCRFRPLDCIEFGRVVSNENTQRKLTLWVTARFEPDPTKRVLVSVEAPARIPSRECSRPPSPRAISTPLSQDECAISSTEIGGRWFDSFQGVQMPRVAATSLIRPVKMSRGATASGSRIIGKGRQRSK